MTKTKIPRIKRIVIDRQMENLVAYPHPLFKQQMDELVERYDKPEFAMSDPVQFPRRYNRKQDAEIVAFLIATIAWGRREMIINSSERLLNMMGESPYDYVMNVSFDKIDASKSLHRTFFGRDLIYIIKGLREIYGCHDSLEDMFVGDEAWQGIDRFRQAMHNANGCFSKHIANPEKSACKRLHLALRWLVRNDGIVDLGIWNKVKPSQLIIPLDVHVGEIARMLKITSRHSNDRQAACEITQVLRSLDSEDPIKYDFALFGAGIELAKEKKE